MKYIWIFDRSCLYQENFDERTFRLGNCSAEISLIDQTDIEQKLIYKTKISITSRKWRAKLLLLTYRQKLCPKCQKEVIPFNDVVCCEYCNKMTVEPFCLKENSMRFTVFLVEDNSKVHLTTPFNLLQ